MDTRFHRHPVTPSRPKNDINITGNGKADKEIVKESTKSDNKDARDAVAVVTVAVQENGPYSCPYCDKHFDSEDLRVRHSVNIHKGWSAYPGPPDLEKYREFHRDGSKLADMAEANLVGNGVLGKEPNK